MGLIFVGDITYPQLGAINIDSITGLFENKILVGNLEGPIVDSMKSAKAIDPEKYNLYSCNEVIEILNKLNVKAVSLANNHFCDYKYASSETIKKLDSAGIDFFGLKDKKWTLIQAQGVEYILYGTYTFVTGGNRVRNCAINSFHSEIVLDDLVKLRESHPFAVIVVYIHWGYELANYPLPADREWAIKAIDVGASAVVGHHPHVIQDIEIVNEKNIIVFSLGNFLLPQIVYDGKQLEYKDTRVLHELAVELDGNNDLIKDSKCYTFTYSSIQHDITHKKSCPIDTFVNNNPFNGVKEEDYLQFYKKNTNIKRYPIYSSYRNTVQVFLNNFYIKLLKTVRKVLIKLGFYHPY